MRKSTLFLVIMLWLAAAPVGAQEAVCDTCTIITPTVWTPITETMPFDGINTYLLSATTSLNTTHTSATLWIANYITITAPTIGAAWYGIPLKYVRMLEFFEMFRRLIPFMLSVVLFRLSVDFAAFVIDNMEAVIGLMHKIAEVIRWVIDFIIQLIDILIPLSIAIALVGALAAPARAQGPSPTPPDPSGVVPLLPTPSGTQSATLQLADWWCFDCYDVNDTAKTFFISLNSWHLIDGVLAISLAFAVYEYLERRAAPWVRNYEYRPHRPGDNEE